MITPIKEPESYPFCPVRDLIAFVLLVSAILTVFWGAMKLADWFNTWRLLQ